MPFNSREFDSVKAAVSRDTYRQEQHQDDAAVDALAAAMKVKLAKQRAKGYGGWDTPEFTQQRLSDMLREHVDKGDPVDVANFCTFLAARGEGIAQAAPAAQLDAEDAARYRWLIASCESDGLGYWLPEICLKEGDLFPSKVEADTVIDAARKQGANHD